MLIMPSLAWFAAMAPSPTDAEIELQQKLDRMANPHNDHFKRKIRERSEIIADYKVTFGQQMLNRVREIQS